jgi:hypothetical protein
MDEQSLHFLRAHDGALLVQTESAFPRINVRRGKKFSALQNNTHRKSTTLWQCE